MPDFVQTAPVDTTGPGLIRGMKRKYATTHDIIWIVFVRTPRWLLLHPVTATGIVAATALWIKGLPFPLALTVAGIVHLWTQRHGSLSLLAAVYRRREYRRILSVMSNWWRIRTGWSTGTTSIGFRQPGRYGRLPWLRHWEITSVGLAAQVTPGRFGWTATRLAGGSETIAAGIEKCRSVTVTEGATPGLARLDFAFSDPLAAIIPITALPLPKPRQIMCGITENGEPAAILNFLSTLVVGTTGSGKSNLLWTQITSALASGQPIEIWAMDPAGGVELHDLKGSPLTNGHYASTPAEAVKMIHDLHLAMEDRTAWMAGKTREHIPTQERPRLWLVIDELLRVTPHLKGDAMQKFVEILSTGRKAAVTVTALTQIPFSYAVGEKIRPLFAQKVVLRAESTLVTVSTLGPGSEALGAKASAIKPTMHGVGYLLSDDYPQPVRFRSPYLSNEMVAIIAKGVIPDGIPKAEDVLTPWHNFEHVLYRWDAPPEGVRLDPSSGERYYGVLYVGISVDGLRRADEHLSNAQKAVLRTPGVQMTIVSQLTEESCAESLATGRSVRDVAEEWERDLIRELEPPLNVAHNPGRRRRAKAAVGS